MLPPNFPQHNEMPSIPKGVDPWFLHIHKDEAVIDPPSTLKFSSQNGYDVTVGDVVQVVQGKYHGHTGTVLNVDFLNASMVIRREDFTVRV